MSRFLEPIKQLIGTGEKLNVSGIAERVGCSRYTVYRAIERHGLSPVVRRLYTIDETVFKELTPATAWLLGFIFADGGINRNSLSIRIRDYDQEVLYKARELFGSDAPIKTRYSKKDGTNFAGLLITNERIVTTLREQYGCGENKTHDIGYPTLPPELNRHFIRGVFDGDGSVSESKPRKQHWSPKVSVSITSNEGFLMGLQNVLVDECGFTKTRMETRHPERNNNIRSIAYRGNRQGRTLYDYLYRDCGKWFMVRKREKFKAALAKAPKADYVIKPWEPWEVEFLKANGSRATADKTGRTINSTVGKLADMKRKGLL